jgi:hypothetical protein
VVGVDAEVVAPRVGAVAGVVLGLGRRAGRPAEPVVERPQPDQEAERGGDQADRGDGLAVDQRLVFVERADQDVQAEAERDPDEETERGPVPARGEQLLPKRLRWPVAAPVGGRLPSAIYRFCCDLFPS